MLQTDRVGRGERGAPGWGGMGHTRLAMHVWEVGDAKQMLLCDQGGAHSGGGGVGSGTGGERAERAQS